MPRINIRDVICIDIKLPPEVRARCLRLVEGLSRDGALDENFINLNVIKYRGSLYAFDKFVIVWAAKQVCNDLTITCNLIQVKSKTSIKELIVNEIFMQSFSALGVSLLFELSRANKLKPQFRVTELAQLTDADRSTLYKQEHKFPATPNQNAPALTGDLVSSVNHIPSVDEECFDD